MQAAPGKLAWLFSPDLQGLYERRLWSEIQRFESQAPGARLVSALVLGPARPNEFIASSEQADVDKFHDEHVKWLLGYLFGTACNSECKGRLVDVMLTLDSEAHGRFDEALRALLRRPRGEVAAALSRLHTRLLTCQVAPEDLASLRDQVLVPALAEELAAAMPEAARLDDLLGLTALVPIPADDKNNPAPYKAWHAALDRARDLLKAHFRVAYLAKRDAAQSARQHPTPALKKTRALLGGRIPERRHRRRQRVDDQRSAMA